MAKKVKADVDKEVQEQIRSTNLLIELQRKEYEGLTHILNLESQRAKILLDMQKAENERNIRFAEYKKLQDAAAAGNVQVSKTTLTALEKQLRKEQSHIVALKSKEKVLRAISLIKFPDLMNAMNAIGGAFNDKPIRDTVLQLGLGAEKGQQIRDSFYKALPAAAILGANMGELAEMQKTYTDESGRAVALSAEQLVNITEIAKGTGIGVQEASKLVSQFELLGMSTQSAHEAVQGVVDTTERMGVSSSKVLKAVTANFKEMNKFSFKDGVKGMAQMAAYAEKFKINIDESINSAQMARSLEGAIGMASTLATLGGEFAKADPFELLFLSRNDPAKYTQKLNEMTKGMASLVKTANGFQISVTPQDLDRLKEVAEASGQDFGQLVQQAQRFAEIQAMNRQLMGSMFSKDQREAIQSMAKLDSKSGIYKVLGKDISKLSAQEVESLKIQQTTLKQRAEAAQTFDEKFKNTVEAMKFTLIPILDGINAVFDTIHPYLKGIVDFMSKQPPWAKDILKIVGGLAGAGIALGMAGGVLKSIPGIGMLGKMFGGGKAKGVAGALGGGGAGGGVAGAGGTFGGGAGKGAGVGLAAVGMGAGIGLAAAGISKLADSMSKLDEKQLASLERIALGLGIALPLMAAGMVLLGKAAEVSAVGIGILTLAVLGIGAGIGIAAAGIGYMAEGMSTLMGTAKPSDLLAMAGGMVALGGAALVFANPLTIIGLAGLTGAVVAMSMAGTGMEKVGNAFKNIGVVMNSDGKGLMALKETLDSIQNTSTTGGVFGELKELLSKPLKVEFKDKNVAMTVNMTVEMDSTAIAKKTAKKIVVLQNEYQTGKSG